MKRGGTRLAADLDHVLEHTRGLWDELRGERIFITGGTGFFGCWLLESFCWANDRLGLDARATVLTRNPEAFRAKAPHLASHHAVTLHTGDVRGFAFPDGRFAFVIHGALDASYELKRRDPMLVLETTLAGARRTLDFTAQAGTRKLLLASSGSVYGAQPAGLAHIPEDYTGAPDPLDPLSAVSEGKRVAELMCAIRAGSSALETKIARGFAFVGPYLPLDAHYAVGNFLRDALLGRPVTVAGDGTPCRSYLYAADLAIWLWTILFVGRSCRPYNTGSDAAVSIAELAAIVACSVDPPVSVAIAGRPRAGDPVGRYVPAVDRAVTELGLRRYIELPEAVRRTLAWHRERGTSR
jgi:dTDP-glucose 4,6-dehydratase